MRLPRFIRAFFLGVPEAPPLLEKPLHIHDRLLGAGEVSGGVAVFNPEFPGAHGPVRFWAEVRNGEVSKRQCDLFVHIANRYASLIVKATQAIHERIATKPLEEVARALRPIVIDVRPRRQFVIHFANLLDDYDWFVSFGLDDEVVACGPRD